MALISDGDLTAILDKLARYAASCVGDPELDPSFTAGFEAAAAASLTGADGLAQFILELNDLDQVADLLPPAQVLNETHPTAPGTIVSGAAGVAAMLTALDTHYQRTSEYSTVNAYLTDVNTPTPALRAHGLFRRYLGRIGAANSFIPADLQLATFAETGATTGTLVIVGPIDTTQYAGAKLVVKNVGALTTSAVLSVTARKLDGTTAVLTATLSTHDDDHETDLSDATMKFIAVTAIAITTGTNGDAFEIIAKTDRDISAA